MTDEEKQIAENIVQSGLPMELVKLLFADMIVAYAVREYEKNANNPAQTD